ncbi:MAG: amidophosphoribosyltransferase [Candidatus Cloacimonetes bacterium]|nr:amidophosphoribosyltransferase [Candidatus Cloacimonadota bacterium]
MCGIIGIFNNEDAAQLAALGLFAEQHRGQESCGMAVTDGNTITLRKRMGLVKEVFRQEKLEQLQGHIAIGHVRYPTRGSSTQFNSQPHVVETLSGPSYALSSNGDIVNYQELRKHLESLGVYFGSTNDGELLLKFIVYHVEKERMPITGAIRELMKHVKGAYSTVLTTKTKMYFFRDPYGFRPMSYGELSDGTMAVASESVALDILKPNWVKEVPPAGIVTVSDKGLHITENNANDYRSIEHNRHCIFEHIYFSRPDSFNFGQNVYKVRMKIGSLLARDDADLQADVVVPVPDSSNFIALGYSRESGIPFQLGLIRNHYVGRTFIKPQQTVRDESVSQKFNVLPNFYEGKRVILVDDSIVRGTTLHKIVHLLKEAGASEVHLRIGSPMVKYSCYYGIDTPDPQKLIANQKSLEEIREYTGADTLKYLSLEQLSKSVHHPEDYCSACFDGHYPVK